MFQQTRILTRVYENIAKVENSRLCEVKSSREQKLGRISARFIDFR